MGKDAVSSSFKIPFNSGSSLLYDSCAFVNSSCVGKSPPLNKPKKAPIVAPTGPPIVPPNIAPEATGAPNFKTLNQRTLLTNSIALSVNVF